MSLLDTVDGILHDLETLASWVFGSVSRFGLTVRHQLIRLVSGGRGFDPPLWRSLLFKSFGLWTLSFVSRFGLAVRR